MSSPGKWQVGQTPSSAARGGGRYVFIIVAPKRSTHVVIARFTGVFTAIIKTLAA